MHELSIALNILEIAEEEAQRQGGVVVSAIHIRLGQMSGIVKEALLSAFELARENSAFADARLIVEEVPILVYCHTCAANRSIESIQSIRCSECQTPAAKFVQGREIEISALEIFE